MNQFPQIAFSVAQRPGQDNMWLVTVLVKSKTVARFFLEHEDTASVCGAARVQILNCLLVGFGFASKSAPTHFVDFFNK